MAKKRKPEGTSPDPTLTAIDPSEVVAMQAATQTATKDDPGTRDDVTMASASWGLTSTDNPGMPPTVAPPYALEIDKKRIQLAAGVIILGGASGSGKSLTGYALAYSLFSAANAGSVREQRARDLADTRSPRITRGAYFNVFEPTSPPGIAPSRYGAQGEDGDTITENLLYDAELFLQPARDVKTKEALANMTPRPMSDFQYILKAWGRQKMPTIFVFDSLTAPCMRYLARERAGQRTFRGGAQPADTDFFRELNRLCVYYGVTLFAIINTDVLPVTLAFEGVVEGVGTVLRPGSFTIKARASGRTPISITLPKNAVDMAATAFGYPGKAATFDSDFYSA